MVTTVKFASRLVGVAPFGKAAHTGIAGLETADVEKDAADVHDALTRAHPVVEHHPDVVRIRAKKHARALFRELAANEHVLQVIKAGVLPE